jgi:lipopolysaccharide/colanic/teichoic acid biosynthesis glycosyltransferase
MGHIWHRIRVAVIVTDGLAVLTAYGLATAAHLGLLEHQLGGNVWPLYPVLAAAVALATVLLAWIHGLYRRWALAGTYPLYPRLVATATYGVIGVITLSYFLGGPPFVSRSWLVVSWLASAAGLIGGRLCWRRYIRRCHSNGELLRRVLIAGANQHGIAVARQLNDRRHGTEVVGFLDDYQRPGTEVVDGLSVVGHPFTVSACADRLQVEQIVIIGGALSWESQRHLAELVTHPARRVEAWISPTFYDLLTTSTEMTHVGHVPLLFLYPTRLRGWGAAMKGVIDWTLAAQMLLALAPLWAYWWIRAKKLGVSMIVRQRVLSASGAFELMGLNSALVLSPVIARLPALLNVLRREMSLVGPRPIEPSALRTYERWWRSLSTMRPGLTGLWRLNGAGPSVEERVALDVYYVRNYSLSLDMQVLYLTVRGLTSRVRGATQSLARWHPDAEAEPSPDPAKASAGPLADSSAPPTPLARPAAPSPSSSPLEQLR